MEKIKELIKLIKAKNELLSQQNKYYKWFFLCFSIPFSYLIVILFSFFVEITFTSLYTILKFIINFHYDLDILHFLILLIPLLIYNLLFSREKITIKSAINTFLIVYIYSYLRKEVFYCYNNCYEKLLLPVCLVTIIGLSINYLLIKVYNNVKPRNFFNKQLIQFKIFIHQNNFIINTFKITIKYFISVWLAVSLGSILLILTQLIPKDSLIETLSIILMLFLGPVIFILLFSLRNLSIHPYIIMALFIYLFFKNSNNLEQIIIFEIFFCCIGITIIQLIHFVYLLFKQETK